MADIDNTTDQSIQPLAPVQPNGFLYEKTIDFSVAANNMAVNDTMQLFDLPAGLLVLGTKVEVLTAEGGAATCDIGVTGGDVDKYIDGANLNSAGTVMSGDAGTAEPGSMETSGAYIATAETASLLCLTGALDAAKIRVQMFGLDLRSRTADPA